jgi:hypothetical protein
VLQKAEAAIGDSPTKTEYEDPGVTPVSATNVRIVGG